MIDERYYERIEWQKFIYISYILGILVWSVIVYLIWWKSKDTKTKFSLPTIFSLLIPYFYTAFELWQYKRNPIYPELASCINFKPQSKPFIATQNLKCSLNNLKTTLEFGSGQAGNAFNLTYVLLLLMIMSTAFKFNIFDNDLIRNFSIWICLVSLWSSSIMYLGAYGPIAFVYIGFNTVLITSVIPSILIILIAIFKDRK